MPRPAIARSFRAASAVSRALPAPVAKFAAHSLGTVVASIPSDRRRIVERNLKRAVGPQLHGRELRHMVNQVYRSYARYYIESFRLPGTSADDVAAGFTVEGFDHISAAVDSGIGPILALPHFGGWEWAAFWLALVPKLQVTAVAEQLEPPELFEWFTAMRRSLGVDVIPLGPSAGGEAIRAIRDCRVLCLPSDRFLSGASVEVEFFGECTQLPAGPATLALRTGAPLLPTAVYFRGDGHHAIVRPALPTHREGRFRDDVQRVTQLLAIELEHLIRRAPEQWHLLQPNWPSDYRAIGRIAPVVN